VVAEVVPVGAAGEGVALAASVVAEVAAVLWVVGAAGVAVVAAELVLESPVEPLGGGDGEGVGATVSVAGAVADAWATSGEEGVEPVVLVTAPVRAPVTDVVESLTPSSPFGRSRSLRASVLLQTGVHFSSDRVTRECARLV